MQRPSLFRVVRQALRSLSRRKMPMSSWSQDCWKLYRHGLLGSYRSPASSSANAVLHPCNDVHAREKSPSLRAEETVREVIKTDMWVGWLDGLLVAVDPVDRRTELNQTEQVG